MAGNFDISFDIKPIGARLQSAGGFIREEIKAELYQFGEEVMAASKEVVPVDTGALMNTGTVNLPVDDGNGVVITLGYGGESVAYALAVHENLDPNVHWQRPGSGPKYLEAPLKERQDKLPGRIKEAVKRGLLRT